MARQEVDIGIEGNDGTGDSIRESFKKVNDNFNELYAIFGLGGDISFTNLNDTPDATLGNEGKVVLVKQDGTGLDFFELVSDAGTNDPSDVNNTVNFTVDGTKLKVTVINTKIQNDQVPSIAYPLKLGASTAFSTAVQSLLLTSGGRTTLVNNFNDTHGAPNITEDNLIISKGFADQEYISTAGGTLTGHLNTISGATGTQVPQVQEVVKKAGDTMTGALTLHDHPSPLNGRGTPNTADDLQAASKFYVDSANHISSTNLFVSTTGTDDHTNTPPGSAGRTMAYAFRSLAAALRKADKIQLAAAPEVGPYRQALVYTNGVNKVASTVDNGAGDTGYTVSGNQALAANAIAAAKQNAIDTAITQVNSAYPDFVYDQSICRRDLGFIIDAVEKDIRASTVSQKHNYLSRYAALRYYFNPSGEIAIDSQYTQTIYAIQQAENYILDQVESAVGSASDQWYIATDNLFGDIYTLINSDEADDSVDAPLVEASNYFNLYVSSGPNKFTDASGDPNEQRPNVDIFPGKVIRGTTTGAIGRIVTYVRGIDTAGTPSYDSLEVQLLTPVSFSLSEELEYGSLVQRSEVSVRVESGIYEEQYPIRVPPNTSIKGDEFRRTIIRPKAGVSTSPYAKIQFYRDATIDGLTTASAGTAYVDDLTLTTRGYYGYHYLTDPTDINSTPLDNNEMDVFLCNDSVVIRNLTCQGHGGFMMVLDPTGSVLTRSPYAQTCSSFSRSTNEKAFRGGMFIDGYAYNMPATIVSKDDFFTLNIEADINSILGQRKPNLPCSFYEFGRRYQINAIKDYTLDEGLGKVTATIILDETSHDGIGFDDDIDSAAGPVDIVIQGAGNRSMLANDYTQVNDLGYGVIATNNALSELVSVFTYYAHTGYLSSNGAQIRSLTGNNSYGNFGMVAEGSDPDEIPQDAVVAQDFVQPLKIYNIDTEIKLAGDLSASLTDGETISQQQGLNATIVSGSLVYYEVDGGFTTLYVQDVTGGSFNDTDDVYEASSTILGVPNTITALNYTANQNNTTIYVYDATDYPLNAAEIEILHDNGLYQPYDCITVTDTGKEIPLSKEADLCDSNNPELRRKIWAIATTSGAVSTTDSGLARDTVFGTLGVFRAKQQFLLNGITSDILTRPSTALIFEEQDEYTYRTLAFENTIVSGIPVDGVQATVTVDDNFDYIDLNVENARADYLIGTYSLTGGTTLGSTQGDLNIAITALDADNVTRINSSDVDMIFSWQGKNHIITNYQTKTDADGTFGVITITDDYSINPDYVGTGIAARVSSAVGNNIALKAGLQSGEAANITVNISTCRATSHDFLDIGTGGFNDTNYPDRTFGAPKNTPVNDENAIDQQGTNSAAQVQERRRGRAFFASTDQDGFFRVGRFFTVDQGTGRITFNAALVLTNIDGIGFKRGVRVNEFSPDVTFTNATGDSVPTETAVEGYINRRLGWDRTGTNIDAADIIGTRAIKAAGDTFAGTVSMGGFQILNVGTPTSGNDAANKNYVDGLVSQYDTLAEMNDTDINDEQALADNQFLVYDTTLAKWTNASWDTGDDGGSPATPNSDITVTYDETTNTLRGAISSGAIVNADVRSNAAIAQSKLNMQAASTRANASGITQADLGLASFDNVDFTITNGWVEIATGGVSNDQLAGSIANGKLANSSITVSDGTNNTAVSLGSTMTFSGTTNEITVIESAGTVTIGLPASISVNVTGNLTGDVTGNVSGSAGSAGTVTTSTRNTTDATHYVSFLTATSGSQQLYTDDTLTYNPSTNILTVGGLTTTGTLTVGGLSSSGNISLTAGNILPGANDPTDSGQNIGSTTNKWNTVHATIFSGTATEALYADLAENYLSDAEYEPGTVLVFGGDAEVTVTNSKGDRRVAGVVTTNPAYLMNSMLEGEHVTAIALQGRVPCRVLGKVSKGDLLVSSAVPGYAIVDNDAKVGTVIGKALANKADDGKGIIEVVVGRV
jgi:hypothetical protein